jgi:hypothetical protein
VLKELISGNNVAFFLCSKISPMKKSFVFDNGKKDTGSCSLLSPWKNWLHCHWKKTQIDGCTQSKLSVEKYPPDIEKTRFDLSPA